MCASLGDVERAAMLYERLLPHGEWNAFGMIEIALGSVARPLGLLARTLGHGDQAIAHFQSAIAMNERMGARPWVAHAKLDLGRTLTQAGDRPRIERAKDLLTDALGVYRILGMAPWERKAERALDDLRVQTG
jgi:tetratricopeptide (TPR) repeat protein